MFAQPKIEHDAFAGVVERITYRSEENSFAVFQVRVAGKRDLIPVVGHTLVGVGENVSLKGVWEQSKFGLQFKADEIVATKPVSAAGIRKYLGGGNIPGIGPKTADLIVAHFGDATLQVLDSAPQRLAELRGIGPVKAERITRAWEEQKHVQEIMLFLNEHEVAPHLCRRVWRTYEHEAIKVIQSNPYRLAQEINGIGFKTADKIAAKCGIPKESPQRIRAGLVHAMQEQVGAGHCGIPRGRFIEIASEMLGLPGTTIEPVLAEELEAARYLVEHDGNVFLSSLAGAEERIVETLAAMMKRPPEWKIDGAQALARAELEMGGQLAAGQRAAVLAMLSNRVSIMTGGPGTGKTHTLNTLLRILRKHNVRVHLAAPTGKAAQRAAEVTGMQASTIHRLLRLTGPGADPVELDDGVLVIDEMSMVDTWLMLKIVKAAGRIALVMVGDVDQLPSVGPGQVLADLIASGAVPVARLTEVFRQAAGSLIVRNAHLINKGLLPDQGSREDDFFMVKVRDRDEAGQALEPATVGALIADQIVDLVTRRIPASMGHAARDIMVLSPMNRSATGVFELNLRLQKEINPAPVRFVQRYGVRYGIGDKVIQIANNYDLDIFNGDIGFVFDINDEDAQLLVDFSGRRVAIPYDDIDALRLAYAMTIHKSQGSQADAVVIPVSTQHYTMLQRNLLYTGVTRAKKLVVLVGQTRAVGIAVGNASSARRITRLAELLRAHGGGLLKAA